MQCHGETCICAHGFSLLSPVTSIVTIRGVVKGGYGHLQGHLKVLKVGILGPATPNVFLLLCVWVAPTRTTTKNLLSPQGTREGKRRLLNSPAILAPRIPTPSSTFAAPSTESHRSHSTSHQSGYPGGQSSGTRTYCRPRESPAPSPPDVASDP